MPLSYPRGTLAEHEACRNGVVVFDVSHLGTVRVSGPRAFDTLQSALTNDLRKIGPGRAQYTHLLNPADASVTDDIIVWWRSAELFDVMPNASNTDGVRAAIGGVDVTAERAILAVQGPRARETVAAVCPDAAAVGRFRVAACAWTGVELVVAGTGYTGEDGVEIAVPVSDAARLWAALEREGAVPAGLGARDTLRLEAGLPLHGHELGPGITPLQAGLGWVVGWDKGPFLGREALDRERANGPARRLRGLLLDGRQPARAEAPVRIAGLPGTASGMVTSGNFSPTLGRAIAIALLPAAVQDGAEVEVEVRGRTLAGTVVQLPFVRRP